MFIPFQNVFIYKGDKKLSFYIALCMTKAIAAYLQEN